MKTDETQPQDSLLRLKDVSIQSEVDARKPIVEGVDWEVRRGDFWVIGGHWGAGKSDLLEVASGLTRPAAGEVHLFGKDITQLEGDECLPQRLRVGLVFQEGSRLFNQMSIAHNVSLPLCYHQDCAPGEVAEQVETLLALTGLERMASLTPARLNRGVRLRIGLARALALKPELLLLDNPLTGLDAREEQWWLELVERMAAGDKTLPHCPTALVLTADRLAPWRESGRQFAVIHDHQWQVVGSSAALAEEKHPILREFLTNA